MHSRNTTRDFLAHFVQRAFVSIEAQTRRLLEEHCDLTVQQWWVLSDVLEEGYLRLGQLEDFSSNDLPNIENDIAVLQERGLLSIELDRSDRRLSIVEATAAGRGVYDNAIQVFLRRDEQLSAGVSARNVDLLMDILVDMEKAAKDPLPESPDVQGLISPGNTGGPGRTKA